MLSLRSFPLLTAALCAFSSFTLITPGTAAPAPAASSAPTSSGFWLGQSTFHKNNPVWGNSDTAYKVFRNVKDYGAAGDGSTDDTNAIQNAFSDGNRCGAGCNSSTTTPAIVYFPPGTYIVSSPIKMDYYSQVIGDATNLPVLQAKSNFTGMALLDADPYDNFGNNWYINQNNFFRQVRNFVIDLTKISAGTGAGIHWQVAQATSLQNIVFNMIQGSQQIGIFMDNGSGGFMSDLVFNGGHYGAFLGNQQFTSRNMTFNNCDTAIYMNWNWGWTLSQITVNGYGTGSTGIDMSNSPTNQTVGSVVLSDSKFSNVEYGVRSAYKTSGNVPQAGGTLIIDNVDLSGASKAAIISSDNATTILAPGKISQWAQGNGYDHTSSQKVTQGSIAAPYKAPSLLDSHGNIFGRSKPQYESYPASSFLSAKDSGCKGDGSTDDTAAIQSFLNKASAANQIAYFDYGAYIVTSTINVPSNIKIVGEIWPYIVAKGFTNVNSPAPVFHVGGNTTGSNQGSVEISDMVFEIEGTNPGAIMIQWDLQSQQGSSGIWDTHVRMGGSVNSQLTLQDCQKTPSQTSDNPKCEAGFLMFYAGPNAKNVYLENTWFWTADHDMEDPLNQQISLYNARGVLIRSQTTWLWGTASEHSQIYNYQFDGASALWAGFIQTETPYMQPNSEAPGPFSFNSAYDDPTFTVCANSTASSAVPCKDSWGLRVLSSQGVLIYSAGFYSFFNNYDQTCVPAQSCQENMIHIQGSQVDMYAVTTKAAVNMILDDAYTTPVTDAQNRDVYGATVAFYYTGGAQSSRKLRRIRTFRGA